MTDKPTLPPLPVPFDKTRNLFSDGQMDERYFAGYRKAIEDAAKVALNISAIESPSLNSVMLRGIAAAIRALGETK